MAAALASNNHAVVRTVEPGVSLFSGSEVRVAILPVGPVPREVLAEYTDIISKFRHISLSATRSFYNEPSQKTPFPYMDWSNGHIHFRFMQVDEARKRSRIADLHRSRQVAAVIGIVLCPLTPSIQQAYDEFGRVCKALFPEALVTRCFVFEPSEDHIRQDASHARDLVMFPPGSVTHLEQHLEVWMHDLAALVLGELERVVLTLTPQGIRMGAGCYADAAEFTGGNAVMEEVAKRLTLSDDEVKEKRRWGRLMKAKGDLCLMAGSPQDAVDHYRSAIELAKVSNDLVWYGAALEAMACARVMTVLAGAPSSTGSPRSAATAGAVGALSAAVATGAAGSQQASGGSGQPPPGPQQGGATREGLASNGVGSSTTDRNLVRKTSDATGGRKGHAIGFGHKGMWDAVRRANVEGEVREMLSEARSAYRKKGGVPALVLEQALKLGRFVAGLRGMPGRKEVLDLAGVVLELTPSLSSLEDRMAAMSEAAQMVGMAGAPRRRMLLLWQALEVGRTAPPTPTGAAGAAVATLLAEMRADALLKLAARALEPPDDPQSQGPGVVGGPPGAAARVHFAHRGAPVPGPPPLTCCTPASMHGTAVEGLHLPGPVWGSVRCALLEAGLTAARQAGQPVDAWEVAAALLRDHAASMSMSQHAALLDVLAAAAGAMHPKARARPGRGPGPTAQLRRVLPAAPPLQPVRLVLGANNTLSAQKPKGTGGTGTGGPGPFIFNPYAGKRQQRGASAHDVEVVVPEWVCGDECRVEVVLSNPLAVPLRLDDVYLHATYTPPDASPPPGAKPGDVTPSGSPGPQGAPAPSHHNTPATPAPSPARGAVAASPAPAPFWQPYPLQLILPPGNKAVRVVLGGRALLPGTLTLLGVKVACGGASWVQPWAVPVKKGGVTAAAPAASSTPALGGTPVVGRGRNASCAPQPSSLEVAVAVLPALPLLQATLRAPDAQLTVPALEDLRPAAAALAAGAGPGGVASGAGALSGPGLLPKELGVSVWEGQVQSWSLTLTNISPTPLTVATCGLSVVNTKGALLKPLPHGHLRASFVGAHLEVVDAVLAPALPLAPGKSATVAVELHVGRPPADAFEELVLEVRVLYAPTPATPRPSTGPQAGSPPSSGSHPPAALAGSVSGGNLVLGRRMTLPVNFRIQPTLAATGLSFLEHYAPLRDGCRLTVPRLVSPVAAATAAGGLPVGSGGPAVGRERSEPVLHGPFAHGGVDGDVEGALGMAGPGGLSSRMAGLDLMTSRFKESQRSRVARTRSFELDLDLEGGLDMAGSPTAVDPPTGGMLRAAHLSGSGTDATSSSLTGLGSRPLYSMSQGLGEHGGGWVGGGGLEHQMSSSVVGLDGLGSGREGAGGRLPAAVVGGEKVRLVCDCVVAVAVSNRSDRYFRVRLGRVTDSACPGVESAQEVVAPGGTVRLLACLQGVPLPPLAQHMSRSGPMAGQTPGAGALLAGGSAGVQGSGGGALAEPPNPRKPTRTWGAGVGGAVGLALAEDADRMAAAELLSDGWAVCWRLITAAEGGGAGGAGMTPTAPMGVVRLAAVDVARSMTHAAATVLTPPPIRFALSAMLGARSATDGQVPVGEAPSRPRIKNVAARVAALGGLRAHQGVGELWSMRLDVGEVLEVEVEVSSTAGVPLHVAYSVAVTSLSSSADMSGTWPATSPTAAGGSGGVASQHHYYHAGQHGRHHSHHHSHGPHHHHTTQHVAADVDLIDAGAVVAGATQNVHVGLLPGTPLVQHLRVSFVQPGFYQMHITDVSVAPLNLPTLSTRGPEYSGWATGGRAATSSHVSTAPHSPLQSAGPSQSLPELPPGVALGSVGGADMGGVGGEGAGTGSGLHGSVREEEWANGVLGGMNPEAAAEAVAAAVARGWPPSTPPQRVYAVSDKLNAWAM